MGVVRVVTSERERPLDRGTIFWRGVGTAKAQRRHSEGKAKKNELHLREVAGNGLRRGLWNSHVWCSGDLEALRVEEVLGCVEMNRDGAPA